MKIEIAKQARMSERGSSLLRLIQNNELPILDLLVRESVQNSLDAALSGPGPVNVEFNIRPFNSVLLNRHFEGIRDNLDRKFPAGEYNLLEIRDSNTQGLTGPLKYDDIPDGDYSNYGNLLKLIYEISMPQQKEGAGGSWGLGKTVYYRVGIGLVIFYTRIKEENGNYTSRLAACLVEDETKPDALINFADVKLKRGIAWWGQEIGENITQPLTDENEIATILKDFNIAPYKGHETGTAIIIPYIDERKLLGGIVPDDQIQLKPFWLHSVEEYLKTAIQRWYAPRLSNERYKHGRWLRAKVNGHEIKTEEMLPLFRVIQALYNRTPAAEHRDEENDILEGQEVNVQRISLRRMFNEDSYAGYISFVRLSRKQLLMNYPDNYPSPFTQIHEFDLEPDLNPPIITYVRKPGMIVGYETSGPWTDGINKTVNDQYIIGIFVPNSNHTLQVDEKITLEEYLRKSEKADHTSWHDWNIGDYRPSIISKIQRQVRRDIAKKYATPIPEQEKRRNLGLSRVLADLLLPPENFGTAASLGTTASRESKGRGRTKGYGFKLIGSPKFINGKLHQEFELICSEKMKRYMILMQVQSETGGIDADTWEDIETIGTPFPLKLEEFNIETIKKRNTDKILSNDLISINNLQPSITTNEIKASMIVTKNYRVPYGVLLSGSGMKGVTIYGTVSFSVKDYKIQAGMELAVTEGEQK